jgi:archaellum biogenesis ATPase FlaH
MTDISEIILRNLQYNEDFTRKVNPFLKEEYFESVEEKLYYKSIISYFISYNKLPPKEAIQIDFQNMKIPQDSFDILMEMSEKFDTDKSLPLEQTWLLNETEKLCKARAFHNALLKCVEIANGENKEFSPSAAPDIMTKALAVSFDRNIGHNYIQDTDARFEYYQRKEDKIPLFLKEFNKITDGGVAKKTLNAVVAETGKGKSIFLANLAANYLLGGETVLYITMEMGEIGGVSKRIDANLMDVPILDVNKMSRSKWDQKVSDLKKRVKQNLVIKQYAQGTVGAANFKFLIRELRQKQNFIPTVIIVDYLNICKSSRMKDKSSGTNDYYKSVSEELRALADEENVVMWTATQQNRQGMGHSDPDKSHIAESIGVTHTFDFFFALIHTEELAQMNQVLVKILKHRDGNDTAKFVIGIDYLKMRFYDINNNNSSSLTKPTPFLATPKQPVQSSTKTTQGIQE